jgi:predicted MFS family arabinose efflux permease
MENRWRALTILTAARTSMGFQFQAVASVSPVLVPDLGLSYGDLGFLISLYFLPGVLMALPAGALGRRFGDKRLVIAGLVLMVVGGCVTSAAGSSTTLAVGRVLSGVGAILLNVLMSKMITDWFAGREIVWAMAVFVNSFPLGVGLALLALGWISSVAGWEIGLLTSAALAAVALLLICVAYSRHPNDKAEAGGPSAHGVRLSHRETLLVSLAGALWGIYNGAYAIMFGFVPTFLTGAGLSATEAGLRVGVATWLLVVSIQAGGLIAQRWGHQTALMAIGALAWTGCLLALAIGYGPTTPVLLIAGLLMGLPVGVIMSMPSQVLRPESRAMGMGLFYLWLYIGHGSLPWIAGWLRDRAGTATAPLLFAALLVFCMLLLYMVLRLVIRRATSGAVTA